MAVIDRLRSLFGWAGERPPPDKPRRSDGLDQMQSQFGTNPYYNYANTVKPPYDRRRRYDIYDEMDELPEIASVLDAYGEDCTQFDREKKASIWIECDDPESKDILEAMCDRLKVADWIEPCHRDTGKYGDDFAELDIEDKIVGIDWRDPRDIERIENRQGVLVGFEETENLQQLIPLLDGTSSTNMIQQAATGQEPTKAAEVKFTYKPWDIVHFRLYRRKREWKQKFRNIYGTSLLSGTERIAKQVKILDDMLMVRRLTKTLDTRVYNIDTGRSASEETIMILKRWRNALKRRPFIDPAGNRFDSPFDPFTFQEDIFWPHHEGSESKVDIIPGNPNVSEIMDIEHFRNKEFGSLRAPKAYFGYEGEINAKATLATQDMKWGRACNSLQRSVRNGLTRLCEIELALHNKDVKNIKFRIGMVTPSVLEDLSRLDALTQFVDVAERMVSLGDHLQVDMNKWREHVLRSIMCMPQDEVDKFLSSPGIEPLPALTLNPDQPQSEPLNVKDERDPDAALFENVKRILQGRLGSSDRLVTERSRAAELPTKEDRLEAKKSYALVEGKIVPIAFVTEEEDREDTDDEE